jgi:hypothetical protein
MKCINASKLDRKSGVRWGEPRAPVRFPPTPAMTQTPTGLHSFLRATQHYVLGYFQTSLRDYVISRCNESYRWASPIVSAQVSGFPARGSISTRVCGFH